MSTKLCIQNLFHRKAYPVEIEQFLKQAIQSFTGRQFVFDEVENFLYACDRGYFTVVGTPGSGKSAFLCSYAKRYENCLFYTAHLQREESTKEVLPELSKQLIWLLEQLSKRRNQHSENLEPVDWGRTFSILLQRISQQLSRDTPLIVIIDGLEQVEPQSAGANIGCLPRYLPPHIYFLLSRRPFLEDEARLLVETPSRTLNLDQYLSQNATDIARFCNQQLNIDSEAFSSKKLNQSPVQPEQFCQTLALGSESNFMYAYQVITHVTETRRLDLIEKLPSGLIDYYDQHWKKMHLEALPSLASSILKVLAKQDQPVSIRAISAMLDVDEYDVEEILEIWIEFLKIKAIDGLKCYRLYHFSFRYYVHQKLAY